MHEERIYLSIRNTKQCQTGRGIAWSCDLFLNNKKAAEAKHFGDGGPIVVTWSDPDVEPIVRAHASANPITVMDDVSVLVADGEGPEWGGTYILALCEARGFNIAGAAACA